MFDLRCPNCQEKVTRRPRRLKEWSRAQRHCPNCGACLELTRPLLAGGLLGLLAAGLIANSRYWGIRNEWLRMAVVVAIVWLVSPVFFRLICKWRVVQPAIEEAPEVKKWSGVFAIGSWVAVAAVLSASVFMCLSRHQLLVALRTAEHNERFDFGHWYESYVWSIGVLFGVASVALMLMIAAAVMKNRARRREEQAQ